MPRKGENTRKTATAPTFSDDETALISESLRIASTELEMSVLTLARMWPTSPLVERMRVYAERMRDIRTRIDA